ncbi:MAG: S46 family peptidase [Flammeovirgaceae bacterium]|nr:S46 family peptidase [Flammeovirgaceae bacterium]MDW8286489.1 S46 family peptidase [Flammeovirgaceae bacterium]
MQKTFITLFFVFQLIVKSLASPLDEGMWLLLFLEKLNYSDMKKKGLKLKPEDIYSVNNASLKDAVVMLGGGFCTAEVISSRGLLLTNHHCAYEAIQSLSTVEDDILTKGFFAKSLAEEKPVPGLTASFLIRIEDVTARVMSQLTPEMTEQRRRQVVLQTGRTIAEEATKGTHYEASVKEFFGGNEYYLFVYETFKDVRLVGNPSESVGKFGGDTDNWMWPRHTGDFSMFRIYADKDNKPAEYSPNNQPLKPRKHLPISLSGVKEGDFTMVMGYPGTTSRFLTSYGVKRLIETVNPKRIEIREKKLALMKEGMDADPKIRLQYAAKYATVSNYWKYFIGQIKGLKRLKVYQQKKAEEERFIAWVNADENRKKVYGNTLNLLEEGYEKLKETDMSYYYLVEGIYGIEILPFAFQFSELEAAMAQGASQDDINKILDEIRKEAKTLYKDFNATIDQNTMAYVLKSYQRDVPKNQLPDIFSFIEREYGNDIEKFVAEVYRTSFLASKERLDKFLEKPTAEKIANDLAVNLMSSVMQNYYSKIVPLREEANALVDKGNRLYIAGVRQLNAGKKYYPDANSTMRLTYGTVMDYIPYDAGFYAYYTTDKGILEKEDPSNPEFVVEPKLKEILLKKDYGRYGQNGELRVAFITNNDITGGNSGSPVINGKGELIGLAFDGNWEAMSGAVAFAPDLQRCINVDIRYVLFYVEKVAEAKNIIDELTLVGGKPANTKKYEQLMPNKY